MGQTPYVYLLRKNKVIHSKIRFGLLYCGMAFGFGLTGCTHVQTQTKPSASLILADICRKELHFKEIKGSLWMKAKSADMNGQFPAELFWNKEKGFNLEITNLIGGPVAQLQSRAGKVEMKRYDRKDETYEWDHDFGGIPIRLAESLLIGNIPCPDLTKVKPQIDPQGAIYVADGAERYRYEFKSWAGKWVSTQLDWSLEKKQVHFHFDQQEDKTGTPLKWEAQSEKDELKVRWKERFYQLD